LTCASSNRRRARSTYSVNVSKTDLSTLIRRKIDTCYTSHTFESEIPNLEFAPTALELNLETVTPIFVAACAWDCTNHPHHTLAVNHLALIANLSDGSPNFMFNTDYL
jgi:hypothetical protein